MALYRTVSMSFWTDSKTLDEFTPEDKYFYLYLFTNPHTNLCGCYEISMKQVTQETGYSKESIELLIVRFESVHKVIEYSPETKEILLLNWHKYNWTTSEKFRKPLLKEIHRIKNESFAQYLMKRFDGEDAVYPIDTKCIDTSATVTVTDTVINNTKLKKTELKNEFDALWKLYPKKQGKDKAYGYYERARRSGITYEEVEEGIRNYTAFIEANEYEMQFVKMGSTFFSQKAWQDEWSIREKKQKSKNPFTEMLREGEYD